MCLIPQPDCATMTLYLQGPLWFARQQFNSRDKLGMNVTVK